MDVRITSYTLASACGNGLSALGESLRRNETSLIRNNFSESTLDTWIGYVDGVDSHHLPDAFKSLNSRNNRLADLALQLDGFDLDVAAAVAEFGAHRVGVIIGTSTSSVGRTESGYTKLDDADQMPADYQQSEVHNPHAPGHYIAKRLGVSGPTMTISTACSSSTKVFAAGERWLGCGLVDAVVVGGVDSMCMSILHGFASLELVSKNPCRPFDSARDGINIGEAAGYALLTRPDAAVADNAALEGVPLRLKGAGEASDAFHMAQPHPDGTGAAAAMAGALSTSGLDKSDIGYVSLHGTASRANDLAEAKALSQLFDTSTLASSTKGWTGHTLGAAGIAGSVISLEALRTGFFPGTLHLDKPDDALEFPIMRDSVTESIQHVMVNSIGFGGNNCSLVFSRIDH